jgi:hypothetical protein
MAGHVPVLCAFLSAWVAPGQGEDDPKDEIDRTVAAIKLEKTRQFKLSRARDITVFDVAFPER